VALSSSFSSDLESKKLAKSGSTFALLGIKRSVVGVFCLFLFVPEEGVRLLVGVWMCWFGVLVGV